MTPFVLAKMHATAKEMVESASLHQIASESSSGSSTWGSYILRQHHCMLYSGYTRCVYEKICHTSNMPQILIHLFMKETHWCYSRILRYLTWDYLGYIQGVCWIFWGSAKCEMYEQHLQLHLTLWITFLMSLWAWHECGPRSSKFSSSLSSAGKKCNKSNTAETPWFFFNIDLTTWHTICMGNKGCPNWIGQHFYNIINITRYTHNTCA